MKADTSREIIRKLLHVAMGLFAVALHWLSPWQAALCALAALCHNLWLFPHYGRRKLERPEEKALGYSGMIGYPAIVLTLCLLLPASAAGLDPVRQASGGEPTNVLWAVAGAWGLLAFGDAFAALFGLGLRGPALPWNPRKRWTGLLGFILVGTPAAFSLAYFCAYGDLRISGPALVGLGGACLLAALVGGLVETLPGQIDDNLTVPLAAGLVLLLFARFPWGDLLQGRTVPGAVGSPAVWGPPLLLLLLVNAALATVAWYRRWVTAASAWMGAFWGALVAVGLGWEGYGFLLLFYLLANGSTYVGLARKRALGIAERDGGRRGAQSVFSKGLFPALFALASPSACVASLAAYAADTVASEVGKLSRGRVLLLWSRRTSRAGEPGGVSLAGTVSGLAAAGLFCGAFLAVLMLQHRLYGTALPRFQTAFLRADLMRLGFPTGWAQFTRWMPLAALLLFVSAAIVFFLESVLNETVAARGWFPKPIIHLLTGALAGVLPFLLAAALSRPSDILALWVAR